MTTIELLYFDGCPSWQTAWNELGVVLAETGVDATVRLRDVTAMSEDERVGFAGSPTVRIDGVDLEGNTDPGVMACRRYAENGGRGWPSEALLRDRLVATKSTAANPR